MTPFTTESRAAAIESIRTLPSTLNEAVAGLTDAQLATPYRPDGWTVAQVVHHLADSHMNGLTRMKLGLTERSPTVTLFNESAFARLADMQLPIDVSLRLLDALHARWSALLASLTEVDLQRPIVHPMNGTAPLERFLHLYAWHGRHHVAHITTLRARQGW